jgi:hypothetical protein
MFGRSSKRLVGVVGVLDVVRSPKQRQNHCVSVRGVARMSFVESPRRKRARIHVDRLSSLERIAWMRCSSSARSASVRESFCAKSSDLLSPTSVSQTHSTFLVSQKSQIGRRPEHLVFLLRHCKQALLTRFPRLWDGLE